MSALSRVTTRSLLWGLPLVYFAVVITFYLRTYDSAQVKITVAQMGITALLGLWLMEKLEEKRLSLSAEYLPVYAPFVAFLFSGVFSFAVQATYKWVNLDEFLRRVLYMSAALIVFDKVRDQKAVERIIKFLLWGLFLSTFYGLIQFLDTRFFPGNSPAMPVLGLDIFIWRQAFGRRVFSTFGNPNFFGDYLVIMTPMVLSWAMAKKSFAAWCLLFLTWFNAAVTETKGAWIGVGMVTTIWIVLYSLCIPLALVEYLKKRLWAIIAVTLAGVGALLMITPGLNPVSIPFRIYTWLSTWEMIEAHPIAGTGIGSFKLIYSAYRRPTIFHIEGKHNTETDHAENEHFEVLFDEGIVGFGIYLWLIFMVSLLSYRALQRWKSEGKVNIRAYYLLGILSGWYGTLIHNNFDVSIRFVSSGVFTGLLPAMATALALSDWTWREQTANSPPRAGDGSQPPLWRKIALQALQFAGFACVLFVSYKIFVEFFEIQQRMLGSSHPGDQLMVMIAWIIFLILIGGGVYSYCRAYINTKSLLACLAAPLLAYPMYFFWGWFRGDVHHNVAIVHSKQRQWDEAIRHYNQVIKRNPGFIMAYYFLGNVFNDRWDMELKNKPEWGDPPGAPRRDFDRALEVYELIRGKLAPNYVQMHHHVGNLFLKRAEWGIQNNEPPEKIRGFFEEAVKRYRLYQNIDPVYPDNYYRMGYALTRLGRIPEAQEEFKKRIMAFRCTDLAGIGPLMSLINLERWAGHAHPDPEAYVNLAKSYLMLGDYRRAVATYFGFLRQIDPNNQQMRAEAQALIQNRQAILERMRAMMPSPPAAAPYGVEKSVIGK
ncbi:MAG: tetratricopeptide repeat protein [Elusimicrobia bacterium]|nr:tetratricopeptide repeat protein [Elusimicrobiota bacterium]